LALDSFFALIDLNALGLNVMPQLARCPAIHLARGSDMVRLWMIASPLSTWRLQV
jgi:hypothetical protein